MDCGGGGDGVGKTLEIWWWQWWWWRKRENNRKVVVVEEDRKNNENVAVEAVVVVFVLKGKSKKEGEAKKLNCGEEEGGLG